ncbi:hypothetical protein UFOVP1015_24 [uncultured Caudovirales phage]|uniref:Uncharacterized protein n=1 Tax=uncultured Caudovirales phage TaxID=2100421 RepID=A0A6J7XGG2_9CAUD|nr:hypothetical protein UFOVP1015_24 [uncultured Caudovirales phage]CAB5229190.1 hypothetical protein UFOVP1551_5 [uncultured Caudovirales phage]
MTTIQDLFNDFLKGVQQSGQEITIDCEVENVPLPVITSYFKTTGTGEETDENFSQHSRTKDDLIYQLFIVRLENGLTLNSVLFSPVPKPKK